MIHVGKYLLKRKLGSGANSEVWLAIDTELFQKKKEAHTGDLIANILNTVTPEDIDAEIAEINNDNNNNNSSSTNNNNATTKNGNGNRSRNGSKDSASDGSLSRHNSSRRMSRSGSKLRAQNQIKKAIKVIKKGDVSELSRVDVEVKVSQFFFPVHVQKLTCQKKKNLLLYVCLGCV